jgi:hypothetical protein
MPKIDVKELIITCEACGSVKKYMVDTEAEGLDIFRSFKCENDCGRNLYSYITVGTLERA